MRWIILLIILSPLLMAGCSRIPGISDDNGDTGEPHETDERAKLNPGDLAEMLVSDDWELRLDAGNELPLREDIPVEKRVSLMLEGLEHEIQNPSIGTAYSGMYLSPSEYTKLQLIWKLAEFDSDALPALSRASEGLSPEARELVVIAMACLGDKNAVLMVPNLLDNSTSPIVRMSAARALGELEVKSAVPQLISALNDPYMASGVNCIRGSFDVYPVRRAAASSLRALGVDVISKEDGNYETGG